MKPWRPQAWALVVVAIGACAKPPNGQVEVGPIVLIVVDTLRADHVSCYGYPRPTSPAMCQLATDGVRYERAFAPRTATTPSIATMLTGRYPYRHGLRELYSVLPAESVTLAERLRSAGYRTGGFVSSFVMVRDFSGFDQGFEIYDDYVRTKEPFRENYERHARNTVNRALHWLESAGPRAFLFVHLIEPHGPYTPPPAQLAAFALPADGRMSPIGAVPAYQRIPGVRSVNEFVGRYDGEIATADMEIGRLLGRLREWGWYRPATIIVVADHGESMGEDGLWFAHGSGLSDAEARVPLIVKFADGTPGARSGTTVREAVSVADIFPTVLAAAGLRDEAAGGAGADLRPVANGQRRGPPPPITETPLREGLAFAAHGRDCSLRWTIPAAELTADRRLVDPVAAASWPAPARAIRLDPPEASPACAAALMPGVAPLMAELLTFQLDVQVVRRRDSKDPGARTAFVNRRGDPLIPLQEHEREALRRLGYLD